MEKKKRLAEYESKRKEEVKKKRPKTAKPMTITEEKKKEGDFSDFDDDQIMGGD